MSTYFDYLEISISDMMTYPGVIHSGKSSYLRTYEMSHFPGSFFPSRSLNEIVSHSWNL